MSNFFKTILQRLCTNSVFGGRSLLSERAVVRIFLGVFFVFVPLLQAEFSDDALLELLGDGPEITIVEDVKPVTPAKQAGAQSSEKAAEEFSVPIAIPYLGTLNLIPFTEGSISGLKANLPASGKMELGPLTLDEGVLKMIGEIVSYTGRATFLGFPARVGLKEFSFVENKTTKKTLSKAVFGITPVNPVEVEVVSGKKLKFRALDLTVEGGKTFALSGTAEFLGTEITLAFAIEPKRGNLILSLKPFQLVQLMPFIVNSPLEKSQVSTAALTLFNVWKRDNLTKQEAASDEFQTKAVLEGVVDLNAGTAPTQLPDGEVVLPDLKGLKLQATFAKNKLEGSLVANSFPLPPIGTIEQAKILLAFSEGKRSLTLEGDLGFDIGGVGALNVKVESKISEKGIEFSGEVPSAFRYGKVVLNKAKVVFNTKEKSAELLGNVLIESLTCKAHFILQRDPKEPADSKKRTVIFTAQAVVGSFEPFARSGIPVLNTLSFKNIEAGVDAVVGSQSSTMNIFLKGDVNILNVALRPLIKKIITQQGQVGTYIEGALPPNWKISDSIRELKGTPIDGLVFEAASFIASDIDFYDPVKKIDVKRGLYVYSKTPLKGFLKPVGDFLGSSDQTFTLFGTIDPDPKKLSLGMQLSEGTPFSSSKVSMGASELMIQGFPIPSFGIKTSIIFRPTTAEELHFAASVAISGKQATVDGGLTTGIWKDPLGIKGLELSQVSMLLGIVYGSPLPTQLGGSAKLSLGKDRPSIQFAFSADASLENFALEGKMEKISLGDIINGLAAPIGLRLPPMDVPIFDINEAHVKFAPNTVKIGGITIERGITLKGNINILGKRAMTDMNVDTGGIRCKGTMDPVDLGGVFKLSGTGGKGSPIVDIELTPVRQNFLIDGEIQLASMYKESTHISVTRERGLVFDFISSIGDTLYQGKPLLQSRVQGWGGGSWDNPQFKLKITFEQWLKRYIVEQITTQFAIAKNQVYSGIGDAQREIDKINAVVRDADAKIVAARQQVEGARNSLKAIQDARAKARGALASAQSDVDSLRTKIDELKKWYSNLPKV